MDGQQQAAGGPPPSRGGTRGGSARPGTSSAANRPMTATNRRPGTSRAGTANRPVTRATTAASTDARYDENLEEQWDDEYDQSDEDEDVFAFVPPSLGPAPTVVVSEDPQPFGAQQQQGSHQSSAQQEDQYQRQGAAGLSQQPKSILQQPGDTAAPSGVASGDSRPDGPTLPSAEEETYYFDEATGAVYDAQGRLVQMPSGFDPAALTQQGAAQNQTRATGAGGMSDAHLPPSYPPRASLDRKSSTGSSYLDGRPGLTHAANNSYNAFPPLDVLDEVEHLPSRDGPQSIAHSGSHVRQRSNRLSEGADGPHSPESELKFNFGYGAHDGDFSQGHKLGRYSSELGQGAGLAHGIDYDGGEVGPRGIKMVELEMEGDEDSPYPEVRASVSNVDDEEMPVNTIRMWIIALTLTTLGSAINQILSLRYPAPILTPLIVQVVSYPLGKLLAATLPYTTFKVPSIMGGSTWSLNPGMFNIKEHSAIVIMANVGIFQCYALNTVVALSSPYYYGDAKPIGFAILLTLSSQLWAMGLAGVTRKFLVRPASMIWPQVLVFSTVFNTLHAEDDTQDGSMSRFKYFVYLSVAAFIFWWFPGWIFTALSSFSFLCWIWPQSFVVNTLFGTASGLGMSFLTFDWQLIAYQTSPLVTPWWAQCNLFIGFVFFLWIIGPILYWTNVYNFSYMPFNSSKSFDRFGNVYNVTAVLDVAGKTIDTAAYESYSQLYLGATYYIVFWTGFSATTAVLVHTFLYHGRAIARGMRGVQTEEDDVHAKMMHRYRDSPWWWYMVVLCIAFVLSVVCNEVYDTGLPVWGLIISVIIPAVYMIPSGFVYALTGTVVGVNLVSELVAGYALPSKSLPNMIIKMYSQVGLTQGFICSQDLKIGHYMKIPPRLTFWVMLIGTAWSSIVQTGVNVFIRTHVSSVCSPSNEHQFVCPSASVYYTSSIVWGVIGPARMFSNGSYYSSIYWALFVGAVVPIPVFFASRRWPGSFLNVVNVPLFFTSTSLIPPAAGIVVSSWFIVGFVFQFVIRKRHFDWWSKYNFITSAAMDTGTILSSIIVFLVLVLPKDGTIALHWWGNDVTSNTLDGQPISRLVPPVGGFAPPPSAIAGAAGR